MEEVFIIETVLRAELEKLVLIFIEPVGDGLEIGMLRLEFFNRLPGVCFRDPSRNLPLGKFNCAF